jgi:hypothetical protein
MLAGTRSSLIEGGFGKRTSSRGARRRKSAARAAAPLLVPLALALTLGVILAVSSGAAPHTSHVTQTSSNSGHP